MAVKRLEANKLAHMFIEGADNLSRHVKIVDSLNVFPVPDGDTGTNMNLSITSGVKEVQAQTAKDAGTIAASFAKGLLMGARGNSGVILSQLFRGFSKAVEGKQTLNAEDFAKAFEKGVETAYKAVIKPVEGTILTVAKDSAKQAVKSAKKNDDIIVVMSDLIKEAKASLKRTPDLLPVLKEVGVVDSGGQGLLYIYEGFLAVLEGKKLKDQQPVTPNMDDLVKIEHHHQSAQSHMATEDIEFGYCTEVMVRFDQERLKKEAFIEEDFRNELSEIGDSLLVVSDEDLLKVHIHAEYPGEVLSRAQRYGDFINIKIENMREQHTHLLDETQAFYGDSEQVEAQRETFKSEFGIVTVSMGEGVSKLFKGLGAQEVIQGGQTMNPSTEDIVSAINKVNAKNILILPNNGNIIMAADQAADVVDSKAIVIPSKTVPQGLAALLAFNPSIDIEKNASHMNEAMKAVKSGQVTYAVRDTQIEGLQIQKDDYIGIADKKIVNTHKDLVEAAKELLTHMIDDDSEMVTVLAGEDVSERETKALIQYLEDTFTDVELDIHQGDQPLYSYIFSVE
ncbi:DAK2 domain-containing protein [Alkalicoccobacillus gibsonii]|uniref:DAK2 domain-containing protein n=1 Tax=Alkalicoccobacillus gibsonii TaxID=79881 RepID=UPI001933060D|nr:DAK2 domain-containing protein [Alkalicoccobacillus gibsonii]MBM0065210.1 DAK2 domain-containing protein [Alkalicoccobacillus gibsonii]